MQLVRFFLRCFPSFAVLAPSENMSQLGLLRQLEQSLPFHVPDQIMSEKVEQYETTLDGILPLRASIFRSQERVKFFLCPGLPEFECHLQRPLLDDGVKIFHPIFGVSLMIFEAVFACNSEADSLEANDSVGIEETHRWKIGSPSRTCNRATSSISVVNVRSPMNLWNKLFSPAIVCSTDPS